MRIRRSIGIVALLLVFSILAWGSPASAEDGSAHSVPIWFGTEVTIGPDSEGEGTWNCQATLVDLSTGIVRMSAG